MLSGLSFDSLHEKKVNAMKAASGTVIAGAKITVTDELTNTSRVIPTNSDGSYPVFGLKPELSRWSSKCRE